MSPTKGRRGKGPGRVELRLLFVDDGSYHHETVTVPSDSVDEYERLIDFVREDEAVLKRLHVDVKRLVSVYVSESD